MDGFALALDGLSLAGQAVVHLCVLDGLTGKRLLLRHAAVYLFLLGMIQCFLSRLLPGSSILPIGAGVLVLYAVSRLGLGNQRGISWLAAVLAFYITQLSFGMLNSIEAAFFPRFIGSFWLYPLLLAAQMLFFLLCAACCCAVHRLLSWTEESQTPYVGLLLLPGLFFFAAELYILHTAYRAADSSVSLEAVGTHGALLLLQGMGLAALLCTLYAYRHLCQGFQAQAALRSLTQAAQAQKIYIAEAQLRYQQTKAFRHDIKNHLSVLDALLKGGKLEEGRQGLSEPAGGRFAGAVLPLSDGKPSGRHSAGRKAGAGEGHSLGGLPASAQPLRNRRF